MGRRIDRGALRFLIVVGLYLFFLNAWQSIPLACASAFACAVLLHSLLRSKLWRQRMDVYEAECEVHRIACMPDAEALTFLEALIRRRYPGENCTVVPALKHPEASLSCSDVMNLWKANRNQARIVIAATCPCDPRAALYARELHSPAVAVIDRRALTRMLRRYNPGTTDACATPLSSRHRIDVIRKRIAARRPTARDATIAALMLGVYLLGGSVLYLFSAIGILFWFGSAMIRRQFPRQLFP